MYVAVLGASLAVTLIGLSALAVTRIQNRSTRDQSDFLQARLNARTAVEWGIARIDADPDWRTANPSGTWRSDEPFGGGRFGLDGIDPVDGNLADYDRDPILLTGTGARGDARYKLQVRLIADPPPLSCLEVAMHGGFDLVFEDPAIVQGGPVISANNQIQAVGNVSVYPDMEAPSFKGSLGPGSLSAGGTPRDLPDASTAFGYYLNYGTSITVSGLRMDKVLLSPVSNPYGPTNAEGIYVLDCQGADFTITKSRVVGTLVLLNPGPNTEVKDSVVWEPAVPNYPALMVAGNLNFNMNDVDLDEASTINFNPPGTPWCTDSGCTEDSDVADVYPSVIKGLVYVSGNVINNQHAVVDGAIVIGNTWSGTGNLDVTYRATYHDNPPPGFNGPPRMTIAPATWRRVVDP